MWRQCGSQTSESPIVRCNKLDRVPEDFALTKFVSGLQCEVPADSETAPLPVLRGSDVQSLLSKQGTNQIPAV